MSKMIRDEILKSENPPSIEGKRICRYFYSYECVKKNFSAVVTRDIPAQFTTIMIRARRNLSRFSR
jgi:hypothetical protein